MLLEFDGVTFEYPTRRVLDHVNFTLEPGQSLAVMGPSGMGKSTLLSLAAGYLKPSEGQVRLNLPEKDGTLDYVIQSTPLLEHRSALDNASLAYRIRWGSDSSLPSRAAKLLNQLGLEVPQHQMPVHRLSGGERQRVTIARAVLSAPALLLADEPTAALDARLRNAVMDVLIRLTHSGACLVIATHDPAVAERCDIVLNLVNDTGTEHV